MSCFSPKNLYGVIGWPLAQTLSPLIHNTSFQALGLEDVYMAWPLPPENLEQFLSAMKVMNIRGLSVTIPHKIAVLPHLDIVSEAASLAGAVNTLYWRADKLCGDNTDVAGFLAPLADMRLERLDALILGAGGAAHAVCAGLKLRGCRQARIASLGNRRQFDLAPRFGFTAIRWEERHDKPASLIINTTPLGMHGEHVAETPYDFAKAPRCGGWAYDLVYNPLQTEFLRQAALAGRECVSGFEMFLGQGEAQFHIWTGRRAPSQTREALARALGG